MLDLGAKLKALELAVAHGAAMVYHEVAAAEADASKWLTNHPEVSALLAKGKSMAEAWLAAHGVPEAEVEVMVGDILGVLRGLAATKAA